ncbi:unnamed protein product [Adineta steineri]|uniref:nicotinamidase n=1 Tax=Adineta steineri TaxID=433720 RepID=A0A819C5X4_9BILA|nr:unnamed protein product [Adineta steineri]
MHQLTAFKRSTSFLDVKRRHQFYFANITKAKSGFASTVLRALTAAKPSHPVYALIAVDVQNGFISGKLSLSKSPAGHDGTEVVPIINNLIQTVPFDVIVYTQDWHPQNHISFFDNLELRRKFLKGDQNRTINMFDEVIYTGPKVETEQVLWPTHCVEKTDDAALHKNLDIISDTNKVIFIKKGVDADIDSYSAFSDNNGAKKTDLHEKLKERNVTHVFVTGLATDYCVAATALDAFNLNYTTFIVEDACRGVALDTIESKLDDLKQLGVRIIQADQVKPLVNSTNVR